MHQKNVMDVMKAAYVTHFNIWRASAFVEGWCHFAVESKWPFNYLNFFLVFCSRTVLCLNVCEYLSDWYNVALHFNFVLFLSRKSYSKSVRTAESLVCYWFSYMFISATRCSDYQRYKLVVHGEVSGMCGFISKNAIC